MRSFEIDSKISGKTFIYAQILFVLVMLWLRDVLGLPSAITYITDVILVLLFIITAYKKKEYLLFKGLLFPAITVAAIVLFMIFGATINAVNPILTLWGARNNLRVFVFFFICIANLELTDVDRFIDFFKKFFWANLLMCLIQYYGFDLKADYLGGFFGVERGSNCYLNVFICIISAIAIAGFLNSKLRIEKLILYLSASIYIAFIAELKVFYVELIIMVLATIILSRPSFKTIAITVVCFVGLAIGATLWLIYEPKTFAVFLDADLLERYLAGSGYTNSGDLNRFTAIGQISKTFFKNNPFLTLFGFGLGGCEYSQFSFLQSEFSRQHMELNYRWFTHAWVYLEQGAVGLVLLVLFFVFLLIYAWRKTNEENRYYMAFAVAFLPTCILGLLYNTAIQIECAYIIALFCAIPYIVNKPRCEE